ncbi:MAG TPA: hypothetical protein VFI42_15945 [Thermomicrobiaceae bacterium]|nr:hypothetical protein [Thermomicrobiaceae bacterium]
MIPGGYGWEPEDAWAYYRDFGDEERAEHAQREANDDETEEG